MNEIKPGVFEYTQDGEIIELIEQLIDQEVEMPNMSTTENTIFVLPYYKKGFHLFIIMRFITPGDEGYMAYHIKDFMTTNEFNFNELVALIPFNTVEVVEHIFKQVITLAEQIDWPYTLALITSKDRHSISATRLEDYQDALTRVDLQLN